MPSRGRLAPELLAGHGPGRVAGVDEAGRGPLAGPVVAAAVILDSDRPVEGLADSKALSALQRERLEALIRERAPDLEVDGEMHGDTALDAHLLKSVMPDTLLKGDANLLVLPNIDAANIAYNLLKMTAGGGIAIGPVLLGCARAVHILTPSATVRRIVNMTALAVVDAVQR